MAGWKSVSPSALAEIIDWAKAFLFCIGVTALKGGAINFFECHFLPLQGGFWIDLVSSKK